MCAQAISKLLCRYAPTLFIITLIADVIIFSLSLNKQIILGIIPPLLIILYNIFMRAFTSPILEVLPAAKKVIFHFDYGAWEYLANRIIIRNKGRSAARNCKGYLISGKAKERICWTVPNERPNATINATDEQELDFCAFKLRRLVKKGNIPLGADLPAIVAPTEDGWPELLGCRVLDKIDECKVLITADNADPVSAKITFNRHDNEINIFLESNVNTICYLMLALIVIVSFLGWLMLNDIIIF